MKRLLTTACVLTAFTGFAIAQSPTATSPTPAQNSGTSNQSGTTSSSTAQPGAMGTQSSQTGVRRVEGASIVLSFYNANPADTRASKLIGRDVYNLENEDIGEVSDLIIDNGKTIKAIVVSVGGFLGMGERNVAINPASVVLTELSDGNVRLVVNTNREDLKKSPAFNFADVDKAGANTSATTGSNVPAARK